MAMVFHAARATSSRKSRPRAGGKKVARNWPVARRLASPISVAGLNSASHAAGIRIRIAPIVHAIRAGPEGSRSDAGAGPTRRTTVHLVFLMCHEQLVTV